MDEVLRQSMEPVLRDLRSTGIEAPRLGDSEWTGDPDSPSVMVWGRDGTGVGVWVSRSAPLPERIASMADQLQEWAIEQLWGRLPTNWPPCPRHPAGHPMKPTTHRATAVWVCPADGGWVVAIGAL